jgi:hypothetical protein
VQPNQPPVFTDAEVDKHLDALRPQLRDAFRKVISLQTPLQTFSLGTVKLASGQLWNVQLYIANEPLACMIQGMIAGYLEANKAFIKMAPPNPETVTSAPGVQPAASGLSSNPFAL